MAESSFFLDDDSTTLQRRTSPPADDSLPVLVIVMMILELVACGMKLLATGMAVAVIAGWITSQGPQFTRTQQIVALAFNLAVLATACPAAIGILRKRTWGLSLGWLAAAVAAVAVAYGAIVSIAMFDKIANLPNAGLSPDLMRIVILVSSIASYGYLTVYMITHCVALVKYGKWLSEHRDADGLDGSETRPT